jgi:CxxC-x17-CxxC domain-containing protein
MPYQEKSLQCVDCGKTFLFTSEEQAFYASKSFTSEPKCCLACREKRKAERYSQTGGTSNPPRQTYPAICAECGKETQVPFQPKGDRPVYCRDCYDKRKG